MILTRKNTGPAPAAALPGGQQCGLRTAHRHTAQQAAARGPETPPVAGAARCSSCGGDEDKDKLPDSLAVVSQVATPRFVARRAGENENFARKRSSQK